MLPSQERKLNSFYEIRVAGRIALERAGWFGDMAITIKYTPDGVVTQLAGPVADRAALFGILNRIRDLGLVLISVNPVDADVAL